MLSLFDQTRVALEAWCTQQGFAPVHARDLFRHTYKAQRLKPWEDSRFPKHFAAACEQSFHTDLPKPVQQQRSAYDASVKFLFALSDGSQVETVLMPETQRITLCVSSQVGCQQGCVFCHTGRMGLKRNLSSGEIVGQVMAANQWIQDHPEWLISTRLPADSRVTNIVFMGMGEPLDNVEAVIASVQTMTDPYGLALGTRRISVSTAGHLDGIKQLAAAIPNVRLALSVHSPDEAKRSKIMPINRRWPLAEVLGVIRDIFGPEQHPVMLQYTLIQGVNDSAAEAARLADLTTGLNAKINLIPLNEVRASRLVAPAADTIQAFRDVLHARGIRVMVRYSKGQDIAAACGQLVVNA